MKKTSQVLGAVCLAGICLFTQCDQKPDVTATSRDSGQASFGGYASKEKWGEHIVIIAGCNDCHTPKKMTDKGPELNRSLELSGHPAQLPPLDISQREIQSKGLTVTNDLTSWMGPWGVSYSANITSDSTGIGNWKEEQFIYALREGKMKGLTDGRPMLPPMPWPMFQQMTDDEIKAIFAYLKSTKPIRNVVPQPVPPATAPRS